MALNRKKIAALTAFNRKNSGVSGVEPEKNSCVIALEPGNSGVNGVEPEK